MSTKHAWYIGLPKVLFHAVNVHAVTYDDDRISRLKGARRFLPRLGTDTFVRLVTLRLRTGHEDRPLILEMTPEEALDLGNQLIAKAQSAAAQNLHQGDGWAVNINQADDGWLTATVDTAAPVHP